ncbi:MAG TPA: FxLYD domain-containing protein [Bryobacteraceae bacterium]|nr:FxLYD domain-containing protein [Bryobacteraceae bacterium]
MAAGKRVTKTAETSFSIPIPVIVGAIVVILGFSAWTGYNYWAAKHPPTPLVLTAEAKQYVHNLQLSEVDMKAAESYMKQQVVEITGKITNNGPRSVNVVEINCVFYDAYGQLVLRERVPIIGRRTGPLAPGQTKNFRLAFDTIPESWNQALPQLVIAQIVFG